MKKIVLIFEILILLIISVLTSCTRKKQNRDVTWVCGEGNVEKLNGKVKTLIETKLKIDFVYMFDHKGDLVTTEAISYGHADTSKYHSNYYNGKKIETIGVYFDNGHKLTDLYKFDLNGYVNTAINDADNPSKEPTHFFYDKVGKLVEIQQYFEKKPEFIFKLKYLYDKDSVCIGVERSMSSSLDNFKASSKDTTKYIAFDAQNNWLKSVDFRGDTITRKITYY